MPEGIEGIEGMTGIAALDGAASVLPMAIARPHEAAGYRSAMLGSLDRWASQRWQFIAPRLIPAALAFVGMLGVLAAMDAMASRCKLEPRANATIYFVGERGGGATGDARM